MTCSHLYPVPERKHTHFHHTASKLLRRRSIKRATKLWPKQIHRCYSYQAVRIKTPHTQAVIDTSELLRVAFAFLTSPERQSAAKKNRLREVTASQTSCSSQRYALHINIFKYVNSRLNWCLFKLLCVYPLNVISFQRKKSIRLQLPESSEDQTPDTGGESQHCLSTPTMATGYSFSPCLVGKSEAHI